MAGLLAGLKAEGKTRPVQPAPAGELPEYLEEIKSHPGEAGVEWDESAAGDIVNPAPGPSSNQTPNTENPSSTSASNSRTLIWIAITVILLAAGIITSIRIERKK